MVIVSLRRYPVVRSGSHPFAVHYPFISYEIDLARTPLVSKLADGRFQGPVRRCGGDFLTVAPRCRQSGCSAGNTSCRHRLHLLARLQRAQTGAYTEEPLARIPLWASEGMPCTIPADIRLYVVHHRHYKRVYYAALGKRRWIGEEVVDNLFWVEVAPHCRSHAMERRLVDGTLGVRKRRLGNVS